MRRLWDSNPDLPGGRSRTEPSNQRHCLNPFDNPTYLFSGHIILHSPWDYLHQTKFFSAFLFIKFIYSEKATEFYEISALLLSVCTVDKSKVEISQNFVAFSEYTNFKRKKVDEKVNESVVHLLEGQTKLSQSTHALQYRMPLCTVVLGDGLF